MKTIAILHVAALISFAGLGACSTTPGPYGYASQAHPSDAPYNSQPSNIYKGYCHGTYAACGYDSGKNRTDANPN